MLEDLVKKPKEVIGFPIEIEEISFIRAARFNFFIKPRFAAKSAISSRIEPVRSTFGCVTSAWTGIASPWTCRCTSALAVPRLVTILLVSCHRLSTTAVRDVTEHLMKVLPKERSYTLDVLHDPMFFTVQWASRKASSCSTHNLVSVSRHHCCERYFWATAAVVSFTMQEEFE